MKAKKLKAVQAPQELRLDIGCGPNKAPGFIGVDIQKFDGVDVVADMRCKWPWGDESVTEVRSSHFLEHLTQDERVHFFNELHRVLIKGGKATIATPHWLSERAYGDPTHKMPPVTFFSYFYVNKEWREKNAPHTRYTCDFYVTGGNTIIAPWNARSNEVQGFAQTHYANVSQDLIVTATKK